MPRLTDCIMVTSISGWKLTSVSTHLIVTSYLCQVSQNITYLHVYQPKICKHFSSLLYACILSSFSYTVLIKDWNYYDCYLLSNFNTVIISCFISMTAINHVSPDNVTASWRTLVNIRACKIASVTYLWLLEFWFILHTRHKRCTY